MKPSSRILHFEALRGIASIIVVLHHFTLSFYPSLHQAGEGMGALIYQSPFFLMLNGKAAVALFFVLSGYVLTIGTFNRGIDTYDSAMAVTRRFVRLLLPAFLSVLIAAILFWVGLFKFETVAAITGSEWFGNYAFDGMLETSQPGPWQVIADGSYGPFLFGHSALNTNLWTMQLELYGSFVVFGAAMLMVSASTKRLTIAVWCVLMVAVTVVNTWMLGFMVGMFIAWLRSGRAGQKWQAQQSPSWTVWPCLLIGLYLLGYAGQGGAYGWLYYIPFYGYNKVILTITLGASMVFWSFSQYKTVPGLSGQMGRWLGEISFPLYLIHIPLLGSFAALAYLATFDQVGHGVASLISFVVLAAVSVPFLIAFVRLDRWWLKYHKTLFAPLKN